MTDTLGSTFATFFGSEPESDKCLDCGSKDDLTILYTTEDGDAVKTCADCKAEREKEAKASDVRNQARINEWTWRDAWEEE
jgi:recombinational DNA repair protein (RecF pathway)